MMHVCENSILRDKLALERAEVDELRSELAKLRRLNEGLIGRMGAQAEAFHRCVQKLALRCPKCGCEYGEAS
jgi:hypothetical protein